MTSSTVLDRYAAALMGTYGTPQRVLVRGRGAEVWDADGRRYLDLLAGIATNVLGHGHPALVAAVTDQLATLGHVSNFFATIPQVELAERLLAVLDAPQGSRVFFCNSGAEANEAALKLARRTGRPRVVAASDAFHGRTMGALSLTAKPAYREPFAPLLPGVEHVPFGDVEALAAAVTDDVGAVFLEPVLGEGGVRPAPEGYLAAAREITTRAGALLVLDEVQTGLGRTGAWFAHRLPGIGLPPGVWPDVVTLAKGLGGGIPVGAAVGIGEAGSLLGAGQHGTTFGGNPVAAAAGLAVLTVLEQDGLVARAAELGKRLTAAVDATSHPLLAGTRGAGLLQAVLLRRPVAARLAAAALDAGFLVNAVAADAVRIAPPLVLLPEQLEEFTAALPGLLDAVGETDGQP